MAHQRGEWAAARATTGDVFPLPEPPAETERRCSYCKALSAGTRCDNCGASS